MQCNSCITYEEVAGVGEALSVLGGERDEEGAELADGDGDEAAEDEHPVPVARGEQLRPDPAVLREDLVRPGARRLLDVEHVVDPLEAQDLELAGEPEQHAHQQEHPRPVHPRRHRQHQRHRSPRHLMEEGRGGEWRCGPRRWQGGLEADGGEEEDCLVARLDAERWEEDERQDAEGAVELALVAAAHGGGVVAEPAVEEQKPPEPAAACAIAGAAAEEGGEREEGDGGERRGRERGEAVEGDGGRGRRGERGVGAERGGDGGGDGEGEGEEGGVGGGARGG